MPTPVPALSLTEAKNKELVPCVRGVPLHSLHNPRREAEVWANNHLAQLQRSPAVLVLGLGFGYHVEELAKTLQLKHKSAARLHVLEASPELVRLWRSYRPNPAHAVVHTAPDSDGLWRHAGLCAFLLEKPAVIIHRPSWDADPAFYRNFLAKRAPANLGEWRHPDPEWRAFLDSQADCTLERARASLPPSVQSTWLRAFWEGKHAD